MRRRAEGKSYNQVIRSVEEEFHVRLNKSHVSDWVRGEHVPDGSVRKFLPVSTAELGYVIGVMLGDGSMSVCGDHNYRLKLRVTDRDFAQAFAQAITVVLERSVPHVRYHAKTNAWHVDASSLLLQEFLKKPVAELGGFIGQSGECTCGFLRGFFDSEGSMFERSLTASNGDPELLNLVCARLAALGIETTGPRLVKKGGQQVMIRGKLWMQNLDQYIIYVRTRSLAIFQARVGFSIRRKYDALAEALSRG